MYRGKYAAKSRKTGKSRIALLVSLALVVTVLVGGTIAWLTAQTPNVTNTFTPGQVACSVQEPSFEQGKSKVKENVTIKNEGNVDAYIRATYVVTWQDGQGNVLAQPVQANEYAIEMGTNWTQGTDGYYYYGTKVAPGAETPALIVSCEPTAAAPAGYTLHVEILAQAIQADGNAVTVSAAGWHIN